MRHLCSLPWSPKQESRSLSLGMNTLFSVASRNLYVLSKQRAGLEKILKKNLGKYDPGQSNCLSVSALAFNLFIFFKKINFFSARGRNTAH